ncbi:MAG: Hsp20/alpha crystallin family protein [Bacteroidota bacterium]
MTLVKRNQLRMRRHLRNPFERLFNHDLPSLWDDDILETVPSVNITEKKDHYRIELAVPGMKKEDFNIEVDGNFITVSAEKESEKEDEEDSRSWKEYNYSSFSRSFTLPDNAEANADNITAKYEDGVLRFEVPKKAGTEKSGARKIEVK